MLSTIGIELTKFWEAPMGNTNRVHCFGVVLDSHLQQLKMGILIDNLLSLGGELFP